MKRRSHRDSTRSYIDAIIADLETKFRVHIYFTVICALMEGNRQIYNLFSSSAGQLIEFVQSVSVSPLSILHPTISHTHLRLTLLHPIRPLRHLDLRPRRIFGNFLLVSMAIDTIYMLLHS